MGEDRILRLQGVHNFRDYGGYPVSGGGRLKRGLLWRSGQHHGASDEDLERISALNLTSVFDLRTSRERSAKPCRRPLGFEADVHLADDPARQHAPHLAAARAARERTPQSMHEAMIRNYGGISFRPELQSAMRRFFQVLARGQGASLVNCMAGKDRTGIAVAMLHIATGVHRDDVIEDYLLTNTAGDVEARIAAGADTVRAISGPMEEEILRVLMSVDAEWLEAAFAAIAERHGSIDGYLKDALGVDEAVKEELRAALVES